MKMNANTRGAIFSAVLIGLLGSEALWTHLFKIPNLVAEAAADEQEQFEDKVQAKMDSTMAANVSILIEAIPSILATEGLMEIDSTPEKSMERILKLIAFGESRMADDSVFKAIYEPFLKKLINQEGSKYLKCDYVLSDKGGTPRFYVDCWGDWRKILKGRPNNRLVKDVYYYKDRNGTKTVISSLGNPIKE